MLRGHDTGEGEVVLIVCAQSVDAGVGGQGGAHLLLFDGNAPLQGCGRPIFDGEQGMGSVATAGRTHRLKELESVFVCDDVYVARV